MPIQYVDYSAYDEATRHVHALMKSELAHITPSTATSTIRGVGFGKGLLVFVSSETSEDDVRREMTSQFGVPPSLLASIPLEVVVSGAPFTTAQRYRPVPGGCSGSNLYGQAGTLGCLTVGLSGTWNDELQILGNNHVLARNNAGQVGDPVVQPGVGQGGGPNDQVATLAQWVPLFFEGSGRTNYMDAATAWVSDQTLVTPQILDIAATTGNSELAYVGQGVQKSGAVSGLRSAAVLATGVSQWINGGTTTDPLWGYYADLIVAGEEDLVFQASGDSGAILWTTGNPAAPVGLLFAAGPYNGINYCGYASPIGGTLDVLNLQIIGYP